MIGSNLGSLRKAYGNACDIRSVLFRTPACEVGQLHIVTKSRLNLCRRHGKWQADGAPLVGLDGTSYLHVDVICGNGGSDRCLAEKGTWIIGNCQCRLHKCGFVIVLNVGFRQLHILQLNGMVACSHV